MGREQAYPASVLDETVRRSLTTLAGAAALLFAVNTTTDAFGTPETSPVLVPYGYVAAAGSALLYLMLRDPKRMHPRSAHPLLGVFVVMGLLYCALFTVITADRFEACFEALIIVSGAMFILSWRWFLAIEVPAVVLCVGVNVAYATGKPIDVTMLLVTAGGLAASIHGTRLRAVRRLEGARDELEQVNRSLKEFVAVAAHDLRTPLTSILGFVQMLRERDGALTDQRRAEFLEVIHRQSRRLERLVDDLLTLSRIESGAVRPHLMRLSIERELEQSLAELGVADAVTIATPGPIEVHVDPDHLHRMLQNYIGNALKYGSRPIVAEVVRDDRWVDIKVRDGGTGVPPEFRQRLFEKFARADTMCAQTGTGLGLSIVRGLARANGGDAWYEPNEPHGSCFALRLPTAA